VGKAAAQSGEDSSAADKPPTHAARPDTGGAGESLAPKAIDFPQLVGRHEPALLRYVGQLLGRRDAEAEDIVQDAFLRLHRYAAAHGPGAIDNVVTWLYRVTHNLVMDALRRRRVRSEAQEQLFLAAATDQAARVARADSIDDSSTALGELERLEACDLAMRELHLLPENQKQTLLLRMIDGLTIRQIAEVTDTSISNVAYRLTQGLATLAKRLKEAGVV
jgi:RNA polymerase sigma-70 factor (ECF subfamily)